MARSKEERVEAILDILSDKCVLMPEAIDTHREDLKQLDDHILCDLEQKLGLPVGEEAT